MRTAPSQANHAISISPNTMEASRKGGATDSIASQVA